MKIMMSSCLIGENVMYWGGNFLNQFLKTIIDHPEVELVHFCPEHAVLGTPRKNMLLHGGDGSDVWAGKGQLLATDGTNYTALMKKGAQQMLAIAQASRPDLIIMTEGSDSCGSQVVLDSETENNGKYKLKSGIGLAAYLLRQNGFNIMSHKNEKQIYNLLRLKLKSFQTIKGLKNLEI